MSGGDDPLAERQTLYFIYGVGCGACEAAEPHLVAFEAKSREIIVLRINAAGPIPATLGIDVKATPTYLFRVGDGARMKAGAMTTAELTKWVKSIGGRL